MSNSTERTLSDLSSIWFRRTVCLLFLLFIPLWASGEASDGENLITNGDFELRDDEGMPDFWYPDAYVLESGYTVFGMRDRGGSEHYAAEIHNIGENDARYAQSVAVEPESLYRLSGWVMADHVEGGHGANLSIEGVYAFSEKTYDTAGEWKYIEYYGETGPGQEELTVFVRLGGYSGESTGTAAFDDICLVKVDRVPGDGIADLWFRDEQASSSVREEEDDKAFSFRTILILVSLAFLLALSLLYHKGTPAEKEGSRQIGNRTACTPAALMILFLGLAIRLLLAAFAEGYMVDVNCFLSWGHTFSTVGPAGFYEATNFCDYPPLYTYVLGLNSATAEALNAGDSLTRIIFRLVPCLCDLAASWILYRLLLRRTEASKGRAAAFLAFLVLNPAMILNSAAWGQMDSVLCLLLMSVALLAVDGRWAAALPLYVVSVLVKPQALMLGPLGLVYILVTLFRKPECRKSILIGTLLSFLALAAGVIPFSLRQNWDWLITLYARTLSSYPYATVNTANFYYLLGGNWTAVEQQAHVAAPVLLSAFCAGWTCFHTLRARNDRCRWIETGLGAGFTVLFLVLALTGASWGWVGGAAMAFAFVIVLSPAIRNGRIEMLPYLGGLLYILLYVFGVKMHERYLFPALLLLAAAYVLLKDRRILLVLGMFTVTLFLNEGIVLDNSMRLGSRMGHLNQDTVWLADILSLVNILTSFYAVWLMSELQENRKDAAMFPVTSRFSASDSILRTGDRSLHWNRRDSLILLSVTAVYSLVSLLTLGSTRAPQTVWTASSPDETVVFDLGEERNLFSMLYFAQVSRNDFSVSVSMDGENWGEEYPAQMNEGQCWKWKYLTQSSPGGASRTYYNSDLSHVIRLSGRYVRLSACSIGLKLCEVLFRDEDDRPIPARIYARNGASEDSELYSDPSALLDEQDTLDKLPELFGTAESRSSAAQPGWWNSTYFDEIYHARTAYEFLQGTIPYETSHPPLGKLLMSACVAVFGMTPFGWRLAGAMAGILMLPGMYLLGKQLTKRTWLASLGTLMMALDCLHLTQTQIATIDSFPVLFILFAYFFMLRFLQSDPYRDPMKALLPSLGLSGLFMGLSIASKWIGIYAGCGLAVLFFWHCFRMMRLLRREDRNAAGRAWQRLINIGLWCLLFFLFIPAVIYLLSYIPYFAYDHRIKSIGDYLNRVWNAQLGMFNYHSTPGLGMDHPFYSPWWEWPVIGKPMYYAAESYIPDGWPVHHSIFAFGNPVIWFGGLAALGCCIVYAVFSRRYRLEGSPYFWHSGEAGADPSFVFLFVGILAQYLPWVLVPRGTYIYHYFASLPFLMLSVCIFFGLFRKRSRMWKTIAAVFILAAAVFFILLFPYASGIAVPSGWLDIGSRMLKIWY